MKQYRDWLRPLVSHKEHQQATRYHAKRKSNNPKWECYAWLYEVSVLMSTPDVSEETVQAWIDSWER
jgi:hypothetical protein